jgi:hypothetical protein
MNLERLLEAGAIVAKFGGSGGSGQGSNGSRGGDGSGGKGGMGGGGDKNKNNKNKNNTSNTGTQSTDKGKGGQKDVGGQNSPTGDSADNGRRTEGRQTDEQRRHTNPFAANRQMDATVSLSHPDQMTESSRRSFDHARQAMTYNDKQTAARESRTSTQNAINLGFDIAKPASALLSPAAPLAVQAVQDTYNANIYSDNMETLGVPQSTADTVNEFGRSFVPSTIASLASPIGAKLGFGVVGQPVGALLGSKAVSTATDIGLTDAIDTAYENNRLGIGGPQQQVADNGLGGKDKQTTAPSTPSVPDTGTSLEKANAAFGVAQVNMNNYSKGLIG